MPDDFAAFFLDRFYSDLPIYAVIAGVSFSRHYAEQVRRSAEQAHELALRTTDLERRLVESRLQSLRAQLQPHFLFNALNTISAFTESNPQMARRLMEQLGDLLRASLRHAAQPLVTLGEELTFLDDFLAIESARFEGRLHVSVHADDELLAGDGAELPAAAARRERDPPRRRPAPVRRPRRRHRDGHAGRRSAFACATTAWGCRADWSFERDAGVGLRNVAARLEHLYGRPGLLRVVPRGRGRRRSPDRPAARADRRTCTRHASRGE